MKTSGVYGWKNTLTGKWYIGSSVHIERRRATHLKELGNGTHNGPKLLRAWQKYGSQAWEFIVLERCEPVREILMAREQHWLDFYDSYNNGYNTLPKAGSVHGVKWTEERRRKTIASRIASGGWHHSEETRKLLGDIQRGKKRGPMPEAQRLAISLSHLKNGMPESERQRISRMAKERVYTDEIRKNMGKAHEGFVMPQAQKDKIAAAHEGKTKSPESVARLLKKWLEQGKYIMPEVCRKYGLPVMLRTCAVCSKGFEPATKSQKTCGSACFKEACSRASKRLWESPQAPKMKTSTTEDFIEKARKVHGDRYGYEEVEYKKSTLKVVIVCPVHGGFEQTPNGHLAGRGCADCRNSSFSERNLRNSEASERMTEMSRIASCQRWNINRGKPCTCGRQC